jgi:hypothetical protein
VAFVRYRVSCVYPEPQTHTTCLRGHSQWVLALKQASSLVETSFSLVSGVSTLEFTRGTSPARDAWIIATNPLQSIFPVTLLCTLVLHRLWRAYNRMDKAQ